MEIVKFAIFMVGMYQLSIIADSQSCDHASAKPTPGHDGYGLVHNDPCGSVQPVYKMALKGHVFKTLRLPNALHCLKACNSDARCQSINQLMGPDVCELNNRTREAHPEDLVHDIDKLYMKRFVNRGKNIV